jgi:hypothetical protein
MHAFLQEKTERTEGEKISGPCRRLVGLSHLSFLCLLLFMNWIGWYPAG